MHYHIRLFLSLTRISLIMLILFTIICGVFYPGFVTIVLKTFAPSKAEGSFVENDGKIIGSSLIGQHFSDPKYFWGRPPQNNEKPYDFKEAQASHLSPKNPKLKELIQKRIDHLMSFESDKNKKIPLDLVTSSGSDLDPHISPESAFFQVDRIASTRHLAKDKIENLVNDHIEHKIWGFLGEKRVNVLALNLALDALKS
ncbi:MAG: potassium-transporting ATPase subunit KdpC [Alphaproteobacteria bacterium]|nr:potassium-transporting ATPase subunit KdpC [Alphaproteobacteria bacterium]